MRTPAHSRRQRGFTLIELLITLAIVSVGLLGMAKLQAAALAEAQVSRVRSLMTFQAESLSGMMTANRSYWASTTGAAGSTMGFKVAAAAGTAVDTSSGTTALDQSVTCSDTTKTCTAAQIAGFDAKQWAAAYSTQFPSGTANVTCTLKANLPTTCDITLVWSEHYVGVNRNTAGGGAKMSDSTINMTLHVQP